MNEVHSIESFKIIEHRLHGFHRLGMLLNHCKKCNLCSIFLHKNLYEDG